MHKLPSATMSASLQNMPVELLIEIIKLAAKGSSRLSFCHVNRAMRRAALSAPDIWRNLRTVCTVYVSIDGPLIPKSNFEFISFWCDRVKRMNTFAVNFEIDFVKTRMKLEWVSLDGPRLWMIIRLLTRARYLRTESTTLAYLRCRVEACPPAQQESSCDSVDTPPLLEYTSRQTTFPFLESLVIESAYTEQDGYDDELRSFLASFRMPALRKCTLGTLVLCYATPTDDLPRSVQIAFKDMWSQLTHIDAAFRTTLTDWKIFFGGLNSAESARITLTIVDSGDVEHETVPSILPNLRELWIKINPGCSFGNVLGGFHLPVLKILLLRAPRLTLECFHRLLRATRVLERIRLCSIFPTIDLEACFVKFPVPSERLKAHAPHLQQIMIDIPSIDQFETSFREYVDGMVESGWLEGPWKSGTLRVEFFWICEPESMRRMIEDLQQYLGLRRFGKEVIITLREKVDEPQEESGNQLWDLWFDFGQEF